MRQAAKVLLILSAALFLVQCGKNTPTNQKGIRFGTSTLLVPFDLPANQTGNLYELWVCSLQQVTPFKYVPVYQSLGRFGWNNYVFTFLDANRQPRGGLFGGSAKNLFSPNLTQFVPPDTAEVFALAIGENDTVRLRPANQALAGLKALLMSVEPVGDTGQGLAFPNSPCLIGFCNDSGVVRMSFIVNNRKPDPRSTYFLATPSDATDLLPVSGCCVDTTSFARNNESKGIWFGKYDPATGQAKTDTVFRDLRLPKGWQYEGWVEKDGILASTGKFIRTDSADFDNSHSPNPSPSAPRPRIFNLPGEDFFINPPFANLLGGTVLISYEPLPDPDPGISGFIFFRDTIRTQTFDTAQRTAINLQTEFLLDNRSRFLPIIRAVVQEEQ